MANFEDAGKAAKSVDKAEENAAKPSDKAHNPLQAEWQSSQSEINAAQKHFGSNTAGLDKWENNYDKALPKATVSNLAIEFGEKNGALNNSVISPDGKITPAGINALEQISGPNGSVGSSFDKDMLNHLSADATKLGGSVNQNDLKFFGAEENNKMNFDGAAKAEAQTGKADINTMFTNDKGHANGVFAYLDTAAGVGKMDGKIASSDLQAILKPGTNELTQSASDVLGKDGMGLSDKQLKEIGESAHSLIKNWTTPGVQSELKDGYLTPGAVDAATKSHKMDKGEI